MNCHITTEADVRAAGGAEVRQVDEAEPQS